MTTTTTTITSFDRQTVADLHEEIAKALAPIAERHGLTIDRKRCTFGSTEMPVAFELRVKALDDDGTELSKAGLDFKKHASRWGLDPNLLGAVFTFDGDQFEITGLRPRARKRPVIGRKVSSGKEYVFTAGAVTAGLPASHDAA